MRPLLSAIRLTLGLLVFGAIGWQLNIHVGLGLSVVNFFSYFTNLSNLAAASVLVVGALRGFSGRAPSTGFDQLRFMSVVNMAIVGVMFSLLLRDVDLGSLLPWIDTLLHYVMPCVVVVDWVVDPPATRLGNFALLRLEVFPTLYLAYVLLRGSSSGWYPYPFLNPETVAGYGAVAMYAVGIAVTFVAVGWGLLKLRMRGAAPVVAAVVASSSLGVFARPTELYAQGLPRYTATRELTIDGEKADLVPIGTLVVDARGLMYVGQWQDQKILVFSPDGSLVRTIGRKGNGPGEFESVGPLGIIGDSLWAWDAEKSRITWFTLEGKRRHTTTAKRVNAPTIKMQPMVRAVRADGSMIGIVVNQGSREILELLVDANGRILDTLNVRPRAHGVIAFSSYDDGKWHLSPDTNPPIISAAQDGSRIAIATATPTGELAGTGSVSVLTHRGDTLFTRRYPIALKPIPASVVDSAFNEIAKKNPQYAAFVRTQPIAGIYPPVEYLRISRDGALLLAFYTDGPERDFFIISAKGELEAQLTLPSEVRVKTFDNEHLWGTIKNADDLESNVRLKLVKHSGTPHQ